MVNKFDKMQEANLDRLSILQRMLHIQELLLAIAVKEAKALYMAVYNRMDHAIKTHKNYVRNNPRTTYLKEYNQTYAKRISEQHKEYYKLNADRIKQRQRDRYKNQKENKNNVKGSKPSSIYDG